jgi:hypothetical protein
MSRLLLLLSLTALLGSCAYTGDPNQGGLFGWSQTMADDRIAAREQRLNQLDRENAYQRGRTDALEAEKARKQRQLNQ